MKDNHEREQANGAEQEISKLYRQMATELPSAELDNTLLHLARNKEVLMAPAEVKPLSLIDRIRARSGALAMAASVVLVGSVVLLQDWRQELMPKRYGPQSSSQYDYAAPPAEPAEQPAQTTRVRQTGKEDEKPVNAAAQHRVVQQQKTQVLDEKLIEKQTDNQKVKRFRAQLATDTLLTPTDTQVNELGLKSEFSKRMSMQQAADNKTIEQERRTSSATGQAFIAPEQTVDATPAEATKVYKRPAATKKTEQTKEKSKVLDSEQHSVKPASQAFLQQEAAVSDTQAEQKIAVRLAEIEQLLAAGEQAKAIDALQLLVAEHPDHPLADKYKQLLAPLEE